MREIVYLERCKKTVLRAGCAYDRVFTVCYHGQYKHRKINLTKKIHSTNDLYM